MPPSQQNQMEKQASSSLLPSARARVLELEGFLPLCPFLTTFDLLHLSECGHGMVKYRHQIRHLKLTSSRSQRPDDWKTSLVHILTDQQALVHLTMAEDRCSLMAALSWLRGPGNKTHFLKILDLSHVRLTDVDARELSESFLAGACPQLEELALGRTALLGASGLDCLMVALSRGSCPRLRRLKPRSKMGIGVEEGRSIGKALLSGYCRALQELDLSQNRLVEEGLIPIAQALMAGYCPHLRLLSLARCSGYDDATRPLGQALSSGSCPLLHTLVLTAVRVVNHQQADLLVGPLLEAIENQGCPALTALDVSFVDLSSTGAMALGRALRACSSLQRLHLRHDVTTGFAVGDLALHGHGGDNHHDSDEATVQALEAIREGSCPNLRYLDIPYSKLGHDDMSTLVDLLAHGQDVCPSMEVVVLTGLGMCDKGCGRHPKEVLRGLQQGRLVSLQELHLNRIRMPETGTGQALADLLRSGSCHSLRLLDISFTRMNPEGLREVVEAIGEDVCPRLQHLSLPGESMDGATHSLVIASLSGGGGGSGWANRLTHLGVENAVIRDEVVEGWVGALEGGGGAKLRVLNLRHALTAKGMRMLARAFRAGACPSLKDLYITEVKHRGAVFEEMRISLAGRAKVTGHQPWEECCFFS